MSTSYTGLNLDKIGRQAISSENESPECAQNSQHIIVETLDRWLRYSGSSRSGSFPHLRERLVHTFPALALGRRHGNFFTTLSIVVKVMDIACSVIIFLYLDELLTKGFTDRKSWIKTLTSDLGFAPRTRFPYVTMCDILIRQLYNIQQYTVQCVLTLNRINLISFVLLWCWFIFLIVVSSLDLVRSLYRAVYKKTKYDFLNAHLLNRPHGTDEKVDKTAVIKFYENYLRQDGVYVLRYIREHTDDVFVREVIEKLFLRNEQHVRQG